MVKNEASEILRHVWGIKKISSEEEEDLKETIIFIFIFLFSYFFIDFFLNLNKQ